LQLSRLPLFVFLSLFYLIKATLSFVLEGKTKDLMEIYRTEGIVLQTLNFQDYDRILTVFSQNEGIIKLIVKGANRVKQRGGVITAPLTHLEILYAKSKGELLKCHSLTLLNANLDLRKNLACLEAACEMTQAVLQSQFPNAPAPALYALLQAYLDKIPGMQDPNLLVASFYLKLLRHDGMLKITPLGSVCSACGLPLTDQSLSGGESYCLKHAPLNSLFFSEEEISYIILLGYCQTYQQLADITLSTEFLAKLNKFFTEHLHQ
jgi:DNA repair protein RecO (recombination protein O)